MVKLQEGNPSYQGVYEEIFDLAGNQRVAHWNEKHHVLSGDFNSHRLLVTSLSGGHKIWCHDKHPIIDKN